jgi:hypothetical protein
MMHSLSLPASFISNVTEMKFFTWLCRRLEPTVVPRLPILEAIDGSDGVSWCSEVGCLPVYLLCRIGRVWRVPTIDAIVRSRRCRSGMSM